MGEAELVSVVIPTYQREEFLPETLQSVLNQTYPIFEILVVDDGSTDSTSHLVRSFRERDDRISYLYQTNRGHASARNKGIELSRGKYIAFLDSDDLWKPKKLEKQIEIFQSDPEIGMIYCSGYYINEDGTRDEEMTSRSIPTRVYTAADVLLRRANFFTPCVMIRKECFEQTGLFDESLKFYEDIDLWFRVLMKYKVYFLDEELVILKRHKANFASTHSSYPAVESYRDALRMRRKAVALFGQKGHKLSRQEMEIGLYRHQLDYIKECLAHGLRTECRDEIISYLSTHRLSPTPYLCLILSLIPGRFTSRLIQNRRKRMSEKP